MRWNLQRLALPAAGFFFSRPAGAAAVLTLVGFLAPSLGAPVEALAAPVEGLSARGYLGSELERGAPQLPHILVVATGGTIASRAGSPEELSGYSVADTGNELVAAVPSIADVADVTVHQFSNTGSTGITPADWLGMAQLINQVLGAEGYEGRAVDGVVVTHGTDALEETAYFLNLTVRSPKPVVLVGAMRPASAISADGPLNLLSAVRVAASLDSRDRGALVVLNQEINAARDVTKTNTKMVDTFVARSFGLLGVVDNTDVVFYRRSERRHTRESEFDVSGLTADDLPRVDISYTYNGADGADIDAFVARGARGIVVAGSGAGSTTREQGQAMRRAADAGVIIARASHTGSGRVGGGGRGSFVGADDLVPQKARILLMLALTATGDGAEIQRIFDTY
ncbi:MAG TPA: asparaginase [Acidobacteriota bacterium]